MPYHFFALISRMRYIGRWGLMRNTFRENIQEHSHMVAVLAHALAVIRREVYGGEIDPGQAAVLALYHDAPEILTGDLPTPVKYFNPEIRDAYKAVEAVSARRLLALLPPEAAAGLCPAARRGRRRRAPRHRQGRRQAVGLHQVRGGAQGRQPRVQAGSGADPGGPEGLPSARGGLFHGALPARVQPHPGRAAIEKCADRPVPQETKGI